MHLLEAAVRINNYKLNEFIPKLMLLVAIIIIIYYYTSVGCFLIFKCNYFLRMPINMKIF